MPMHNVPPLLAVDYVGPMVSAAIFVLIMSLVKEPPVGPLMRSSSLAQAACT